MVGRIYLGLDSAALSQKAVDERRELKLVATALGDP
jgi:hypothetical protein